jgi:hypothetical protein
MSGVASNKNQNPPITTTTIIFLDQGVLCVLFFFLVDGTSFISTNNIASTSIQKRSEESQAHQAGENIII